MASETFSLITSLLILVFVFLVILFVFLFGISILALNLTVAKCYLQDKKKSSPRLLVIATLIGDAAYGVYILVLPIVFVAILIESVVTDGDMYCLLLVASLMQLDNASTLFSLLMLFTMTLNRYFAIVKPFQYKTYFKKSNVKIILSLVTFCGLLFLMVHLVVILIIFIAMIRYSDDFTDYGDYSETGGEDYFINPNHSSPSYVTKRLYFFLNRSLHFFPVFQLLLIVINSVLMIFVYTSIAKSYNLKVMRLCCKFRERPATSTAIQLQPVEESNLDTQASDTTATRANGLSIFLLHLVGSSRVEVNCQKTMWD